MTPVPSPLGVQPFGVFGQNPGSTTTGLGTDQNAYQAMVGMLHQWGLDSLAPDVLKFLQNGYDQTAIGFLLQDTDAYKQRFAGNEVRRKQGLPVLSPQDYLNTEASYRQIMRSNGMPEGFYDQPSDFAQFIGSDVSPVELNNRVNLAVDAAHRLDDSTKQVFKDWYGLEPDHLAAYFLDKNRAMPLLQTTARATAIGGSALKAGGSVGQGRAEQLANQSTLTDGQLSGAESQAVTTGAQGSLLSQLYQGDYGQSQAENELFLNDARAIQERRRLAALEQGSFNQGGIQSGKTQLARPSAGY